MTASFEVNEEDAILQSLAETEATWSTGAALFGPGGFADAMRKIYLDARCIEIRDSKAGEKTTEAFITQAAHADGEYGKYMTDLLIERANWLALDASRDRLWQKLKCIQARGYEARRV